MILFWCISSLGFCPAVDHVHQSRPLCLFDFRSGLLPPPPRASSQVPSGLPVRSLVFLGVLTPMPHHGGVFRELVFRSLFPPFLQCTRRGSRRAGGADCNFSPIQFSAINTWFTVPSVKTDHSVPPLFPLGGRFFCRAHEVLGS